MNTKVKLTDKDIEHIAKLTNLPVIKEEEQKLTKGFNEVLEVVEKLFELNTEGIDPTHQVTGLSNIFREDKVEPKRILSQAKALSNSKRTNQGYFVVGQILEE